MATEIRWSPDALEALEDICKRIEKDSALYASLFAGGILELVDIISEQPTAGRVVPEYNNPDIREFLYKSYRIIYRAKPDMIEIVTIFHAARILPDLS